MQSFSDNAKCAERFVALFLQLCTRGAAQRCQDASRYPFVQPRDEKTICPSARLLLLCMLFIYLLFNYSFRLQVELYVVFSLSLVCSSGGRCVYVGPLRAAPLAGALIVTRCTIPYSGDTAQQGRRCSRAPAPSPSLPLPPCFLLLHYNSHSVSLLTS